VGGGIIGLATAREFLRRHIGLRLVVLEKETAVARHQSGHNSGVIHTGIYYPSGSLKARACVSGHQAMLDFCHEKDIPFGLCGKVIVAVDECELPRLEEIYQRGIANGVQGLEMIGPEHLHDIEPYASGIKAIYSPNTGIVDYVRVAHAYAADIQKYGGEIVTGCEVTSIETRNPAVLKLNGQSPTGTWQGEVKARFIITCAGLQSDKLTQMTSPQNDVQIVPFRGDYYVLRPEKRHMVRALIYPVPDPQFPFLGAHFTRLINGEVWAGPNAVLAFAREGYRRSDISLRDLFEVFSYGGFWKLATKYWRPGLKELYRDYVKSAYVKTLQRYMPDIRNEDLLPGPSGIRAQALGADGRLVDDFLIQHDQNIGHVRNAPSPAATSSLVIAQMIVNETERSFNLTSASASLSA
jgi:L-2-hydroxyglutarate oxidase LhgO